MISSTKGVRKLQSLGMAFFLLAGCYSRTAVRPGFDFSGVHRVAVLEFQGPGGAALADDMVRQLVQRGVEVLERRLLESLLKEHGLTEQKLAAGEVREKVQSLLGVDAFLTGSVTQYSPEQKVMVFLGSHQSVTPGGNPIVVTNPVVSFSGGQVVPQSAVLGLADTRVVSVNAVVGATARMVDVRTGTVVWSDSFSYEALDTQSAVEAVVRSLLKTLGRQWPALS